MQYIFSHFEHRFSISSYGRKAFSGVRGFEQVVTNGIPTYYVVEQYDHRVVQFDLQWKYQKYYNLTYPYISHSLKYANGYFYVSGDYFYKTDKNFNRVASYYSSIYGYKAIYYDTSSSLFYVTGDFRGISIFDTNCNFQRFMKFGDYTPEHTLSYFNGYLYSGARGSIIVASKATGSVVA